MHRFFRSFFTVSFYTLLSRVLGFVRDIFIANRDAVLEMLGRLTEDLAGLQRAIRVGDGKMLEDLFRRTRDIRRGVIEAGQHIPPIPDKNN